MVTKVSITTKFVFLALWSNENLYCLFRNQLLFSKRWLYIETILSMETLYCALMIVTKITFFSHFKCWKCRPPIISFSCRFVPRYSFVSQFRFGRLCFNIFFNFPEEYFLKARISVKLSKDKTHIMLDITT